MATILPWFNNTENVVGTTHTLGEDYSTLDKLYSAGWRITGEESMREITDGCTYTYDNAEGLLMPEPDNPDVIGVYLKFVAKKSIPMIAVKVGYLTEDSTLKKSINRPTVVRLHCNDRFHDITGRRFSIKVAVTPRKISPEEYCKHTISIDDLD